MIQTLSFNEMNQAVPGSLLSPRMEQHFECEVPSPSQWSDPSKSPPSLHSPIHYPSEIDILVKEEPVSPYYIHMSKDTASSSGNEISINFNDLLVEKNSLILQLQQQQQQQHYLQQLPSVSQQLDPKLKQESEEFDDFFLDSLVDIKKEQKEVENQFGGVSSTTPSVASSGLLVPPIPTTVPSSVSSIGDGLRAVEELALDHCRQDVERVSHQLNIPKDPTAWSVANVKSWLEFEADQHRLPALNLGFWNYSGAHLVRLNEAQFRELIPQGGELLFAKLEYWRLDIPSRDSGNVPQYPELASTINQPLSINVQPHGSQQYYNVPQMFQSPTQVPSPMFSPNSMILSPVTPQDQQQLSPPPRIAVTHQEQHQPTSPAELQLPTPVIQAERQQKLKRQNTERSKDPLPKKKRSRSPSFAVSSSSILEEPCFNIADLIQQSTDVQKPQSPPRPSTTTLELPKDEPDSDADDGEPVVEKPPSTSSGRGGTHIHLWQFLKELLLHPQTYAPYIRWLDRQAAIFKIEDSVRVAQLWGKRKSRPAMNYDKLSRSIRQYYKKGIMKKTERSQRLVYQFCHPYGL